jgi:hypothetical protein
VLTASFAFACKSRTACTRSRPHCCPPEAKLAVVHWMLYVSRNVGTSLLSRNILQSQASEVPDAQLGPSYAVDWALISTPAFLGAWFGSSGGSSLRIE